MNGRGKRVAYKPHVYWNSALGTWCATNMSYTDSIDAIADALEHLDQHADPRKDVNEQTAQKDQYVKS